MRRSPGKIPPEAIPVGSCCQCYIKDSIFVVHRKEYDRSLLSQLSLLVPLKKPQIWGFFLFSGMCKTDVLGNNPVLAAF